MENKINCVQCDKWIDKDSMCCMYCGAKQAYTSETKQLDNPDDYRAFLDSEPIRSKMHMDDIYRVTTSGTRMPIVSSGVMPPIYVMVSNEPNTEDLEVKLARKVIREQLAYLIGLAKRYGIEKEFFSE